MTMTNELEILRQEIDKIDEEFALLFLKRMEIVSKIAKFKVENNISIENKQREKQIKETTKNHPSPLIRDYYSMVSDSLINVSKIYQEKLIKNNFKK